MRMAAARKLLGDIALSCDAQKDCKGRVQVKSFRPLGEHTSECWESTLCMKIGLVALWPHSL